MLVGSDLVPRPCFGAILPLPCPVVGQRPFLFVPTDVCRRRNRRNRVHFVEMGCWALYTIARPHGFTGAGFVFDDSSPFVRSSTIFTDRVVDNGAALLTLYACFCPYRRAVVAFVVVREFGRSFAILYRPSSFVQMVVLAATAAFGCFWLANNGS